MDRVPLYEELCTKRSHWMRFGLLWILISVPTIAQDRPLVPLELERAARFVVSGRVVEVYTVQKPRDKGTDVVHAIEVVVQAIKKPENAAPDVITVGETIFVKTWRAGKRPDNWVGNMGQLTIPHRGDRVQLFLDGQQGSFEALLTNGIQIVTPGALMQKSTGLKMVLIEPGEFEMGSPNKEPSRKPDEQQHKVRITKPFYLGRLGKNDEFAPYYQITNVKREKESIVGASVKVLGGNGYRLPTEAEWEYACRAGTTTPYYFGADSNGLQANTRGVSYVGYGGAERWMYLGRTTKVGSYDANRWGLCDMHGNVAEWCWDWYDKDYDANGPQDDPQGPASGNQRILRGGYWQVGEASARSASRFWHTRDESNYYAGFRVCRNP